MPKGALLHAHLGVTASAEELLGLSMEQPAIHVRVSQALTADTIKLLPPEFGALPKTQWTDIASITDADYVTGSWVSIRRACDNFSEALGGTKGFYGWVTRALVIDPSEAYGTHNTSSKVWAVNRNASFPCYILSSASNLDMGEISVHLRCFCGQLLFLLCAIE